MATCDVCGNEYDRAFSVTTAGGESFTFDSIECAAHRIAPACAHCGCRILGHGVQADGAVFCCANCARQAGVAGVSDNAASAS
jgi:hypothetical protein